jgi:acetylglutamate kinase
VVKVVKIGGSLLYDENGVLDETKLGKLFRSFSKQLGKNVIYVLGSGKMLHEVAEECKLNEEHDFGKRIRGFELINKFTGHRLSVIERSTGIKPIPAMSLFVKNTLGNKKKHEILLFNDCITNLPAIILSGCVLDRKVLFSTISSDTVAAFIADKRGASEFIMATNTNGVLGESGSTMRKVRLREYDKLKFIKGGMKDKIRRARYAIEKDISTYIVNGESIINNLKVEMLLSKGECTRVVR